MEKELLRYTDKSGEFSKQHRGADFWHVIWHDYQNDRLCIVTAGQVLLRIVVSRELGETKYPFHHAVPPVF